MSSQAAPNSSSLPLPDQLKVAVLMGGPSREREISLQSGQCVAEALKKAGVDVVTSDIKPGSLEILDDRTIDVFFVALHGTFGEDGHIQEILESKGLIYTGSGPSASRLAFDKWACKKYFTKAGVPIPDAILFEPKPAILKNIPIENVLWRIGQKYVVKPLREGSTIGITIANDPKEAIAAAKKCKAEFGDCMIEEFVPGTEVTVGILGKQALPILEIRPRAGFYDYHAKYIDDKTEYLFDSLNNPALVDKIQKLAIACFNVLGCRGAARVDFIIGGEDIPHVLEINTIPGMTSHSLLPKAAAKIGISMSRLCLKIVELALIDSMAVHKTTGRR